MASKQSEKSAAAPAAPAPPKGFGKRVGLPSVEGWYSPDKAGMVPVHGVIMGIFAVKGRRDGEGPRPNILIELKSPINAVSAEDKDATVELQPGQMLAVGVRHHLKPLLEYREGTEVWFVPLVKKSIGSGQTLWTFDVRVSDDAQARTVEELQREREKFKAAAATSADEDDLPF